MNKKIKLLGLFVLILLCSFGIILVTAKGKSFDINNHETWFDDSGKHIVPLKDAESIKEGMSFADVVALIGKPKEDVGSGAFVMKWDVESGKVLLITFNPVGKQTSEGDLYAYKIILE